MEHFVEKIIVVSVNKEVQLQRLMERNGFTEDEANARIASQIPVKEKEQLADAVIHNNGTVWRIQQFSFKIFCMNGMY